MFWNSVKVRGDLDLDDLLDEVLTKGHKSIVFELLAVVTSPTHRGSNRSGLRDVKGNSVGGSHLDVANLIDEPHAEWKEKERLAWKLMRDMKEPPFRTQVRRRRKRECATAQREQSC